MGTNPMSMGMYGMGDDFCTQMMYQQMMNGGYANNAAWGPKSGTQNGGGQTQQAVQSGSGLGRAAVYGTAAAGAAGAATLFTGYGLNSPVEEGKHGGVKFTDDFMKRFSNEYHSLKSESSFKTILKDLSHDGGANKAKFTVTAENYDKLMDELRSFFDDPSNPKVADMSDDLKGFLKQRLGKEVAAAGTVIDDTNRATYELVDTDVDVIRKKYAEMVKNATNLEYYNNYNLHKHLNENFDDIVKAMDNCSDAASKLDFLRSNPQIANLSIDEWDTILKNGATEAEISAIFDRVKADAPTRKVQLKNYFETLEKNMQSFARNWDGKVGFLGKGKFNIFDKKTAGALDGALSSLRTSKAWKHAGLAGLAVAGATLLFNA